MLLVLVPITLVVAVAAFAFLATAVGSGRAFDWILACAISCAAVAGAMLSVREASRNRPARIVPYFDRSMGTPEAYFQGHAVAEKLAELDTLAKHLGVAPLSAFGFSDGSIGEPITWHSAGELLLAVSALLDGFRDGPPYRQVDDVRPSVVQELRTLQRVVATAHEDGARVTLIVLPGTVAGPLPARLSGVDGHFG